MYEIVYGYHMLFVMTNIHEKDEFRDVFGHSTLDQSFLTI